MDQIRSGSIIGSNRSVRLEQNLSCHVSRWQPHDLERITVTIVATLCHKDKPMIHQQSPHEHSWLTFETLQYPGMMERLMKRGVQIRGTRFQPAKQQGSWKCLLDLGLNFLHHEPETRQNGAPHFLHHI